MAMFTSTNSVIHRISGFRHCAHGTCLTHFVFIHSEKLCFCVEAWSEPSTNLEITSSYGSGSTNEPAGNLLM